MRFRTPIALVMLLACSSGGNQTEFHGAQLGMTARQVRATFSLPGSWESGADGDLGVLTWSGEHPEVQSARFELHNGIVVAVRAQLGPGTEPGLEVAPDALRSVSPDHELTVIARDCPVHAEEAARLLQGR